MILAAIEIENYKQYGGSHQIDFPEQGMVAITGPNGAGKTTLFEAIEWCLYGPRAIALGAIPPHGGIGQTRVRVTLQDPHDGRRFVIQRTLRNAASSAEAYAEDDPGQPLVQGPRDVTDYVSKQLIGLPHAAFVSTFFTRQKELTFFGDRMPTERRVEVARLLGFQTIRDAQEEISAERTVARHAANSMNARYTEDSVGRDFPVEIAAAEAALDEARDREGITAETSSAAEAEAERARSALDDWRKLQERDSALGMAFADLEGKIATAASRRDAAAEELARLDQRAAERAALLPVAETAAPLAFEVKLLDEQREGAERLRLLREAHRRAGGQIEEIADHVERLASDHQADAADLDGWTWIDTDRARPEDGIDRLVSAAAALDERAAREQVERLRQAHAAAAMVAEQRRICETYQTLHQSLSAARTALLADGEPAEAIAAALDTARQARETSVGAREELALLRKSLDDAVRIAKELRGRAQEPLCPTCARPLGPAEAERLASLHDDDASRIKETRKSLERDEKSASARIVAAERDETEARARLSELATLDARLGDGCDKIAEAEAKHHRTVVDLQTALDAAGVSAAPEESEIEAARRNAERVQRVCGLMPLLTQFKDQCGRVRQEIAETETAIGELGPITYDAAAHQTAQAALQRARAAAATIDQIDKELAGRPRYEDQREVSVRDLASLATRRAGLEEERAALDFDAARLRQAIDEEAAARAAARLAREDAAHARDSLREAQAARDRVVAERDRLVRLAGEADRMGREADELDRMYREFTEFDKFVADHVGPLLAETTERLLSLVTHGKYDRVRFDENYGIEVYDGDECFKLEGFSGGERDVVALCARLAMSELVSSSALRPPRFLVLDEVFGSLDNERRTQLLETLGSLSASGHFQQMFIISHVDDVQQSPVMNEAWIIEERDGVSRVLRPEMVSTAVA